MRADTLAMLLTMANVGAHGRALVLEACGGLVTGAVAERMGGFGQVAALPMFIMGIVRRQHQAALTTRDSDHSLS